MFINPLLVGGLLAIAAPILVHIAHRRRILRVDWGAMRFLEEMLRRSRSRLFVDQWLLLAVRVLLVAVLALALMRPAWRPRPLHEGGTIVLRQGRVAAVLLLDDSASTGAGRDKTAMDGLKALALAYLDTLQEGDEVSILRLSRIGEPAADPIYDLQAARSLVQGWQPTGVTSDIPALLEAGLVQLARHLNPSAELILLSDGGAEGWFPDDLDRWGDLRQAFRLQDEEERALAPRLLVLELPASQKVFSNVAVTDLRIDRALVPVGQELGVRAVVQHRGAHVPEQVQLLLELDGRVVDQRELSLRAGDRREFAFSVTIPDDGSHVLEALLVGARDAMAVDDRRALALEAQQRIPVLLVENSSGPGLEGDLGFLAVALDPKGEGRELFDVRRVSGAQFPAGDLARYRVVVLGNLAALGAEAITSLERYLVSGGGVLIGLGGQVDPSLVNRFWARDGHGFFPSPLAEMVVPDPPCVPVRALHGHPAVMAFDSAPADSWLGAEVRRYHRLHRQRSGSDDLQVLVALDSGDPLLVGRRRGKGHVVLCTTSLGAEWADLPVCAAYVPLMRGVVGFLASEILPRRNLRPGESLFHAADEGTPAAVRPNGSELPLQPSNWEGRRAFVSGALTGTGVYRVGGGERQTPVHYAVNPDPSECRVEDGTGDVAERLLESLYAARYQETQAVREALDPSSRTAVELWRLFIGVGVGLLMLETLVARRQAVQERRPAGGR